MNQDKNTTEYLKSLGNVKLSETSRARIESDLLEYAKFHPVRVPADSRFNRVPFGTLFGNKLTIMPIAIFIAVFAAAGTSFAANGAVPGDLLYPVKTSINENVGSALALGADAEARFETKLLEERIKEAQELKAEGRLTGDLAQTVSENIANQASIALATSMNSDVAVRSDVESRTRIALEKFIGLVGTESALATKAAVQLNAISLSQGDMDLELLKSDIRSRITGLQSVVANSAVDLDAEVEARFNAKLDSAIDLTVDVTNKTEAEVREAFNNAAVLIGEVEAELSTLGQVEVNDNGMIIDVDFSIDPMAGINEDSTSTEPGGDDSTSSDANMGVDAGIDVDVDTEPVDLNVSGAAGAGLQGSTGLGI